MDYIIKTHSPHNLARGNVLPALNDFIMSDKNTFAGFISIEELAAQHGLKQGQLKLVKMPKTGSILVMAGNAMVATISNKLKGQDLATTKKMIGSVNLTVGVPHEGSLTNTGRPSLPCVLEGMELESIDLF